MVQIRFPKGKVVQERYVVEDLLGKGGFGAVYRVRDRRVKGNVFALKEMIDPDARQRVSFAFEGELLKRLDHRALPRVYRIFEDHKNNRIYMLMDYIDGPNLERLRYQQPEQRFPLARVMHIMAPISEAVSYLHEQHPPVLHRDIKPSNIIVPVDGDDAVLVDFGIAKEYNQESTTTALRHCSPGYGAPEHYAGGTTTRTDVYSLGATFYTLLTGEVPVDALHRMTQLSARGKDPLVPANTLVPEIPAPIADALQRAMAIDSSERFASVDEFWQALRAHVIEEESLASETEQPDAAQEMAPKQAPEQEEIALPAALPVAASTISTPGETSINHASGSRIFSLALTVLAICALLSGGIFGVSAWQGAQVNHSHKTTAISPKLTQLTAPTPGAISPSPSPIVSPSPTEPTTIFPGLAVNYGGRIHNIPADVDSSLSLQIQQRGMTIAGYMALGPGLLGSGNFSGTVLTNDRIEFLVPTSGKILPLFFQGQIQSDGSLTGEYCSYQQGQCDYDGGGYGTWNAAPLTTHISASVTITSSLGSRGVWRPFVLEQ
jgi:serine/threonine protein kinase